MTEQEMKDRATSNSAAAIAAVKERRTDEDVWLKGLTAQVIADRCGRAQVVGATKSGRTKVVFVGAATEAELALRAWRAAS